MADVNLGTNDSLHLGESENVSALLKSTSTTLVEQLVTNETIFPTGYDIAQNPGDGTIMYERSLSDNWLGLFTSNFIVSGLVIPTSSLTLSLTMPSGTAFIAGRYLQIPATSLTFGPSSTSYVYLKVTRDAALNVTGAWYEVNTTGTQPSDSVMVGVAYTSVGAITDTLALRQMGPLPSSMPMLAPISVGAGSTRSHEGTTIISGNTSLSGIHLYSNFAIKSGVTVTPASGSLCLIIYATGSITINGTIAANGKGNGGGTGGSITPTAGTDGGHGSDQTGGNGGAGSAGGAGGAGGDVYMNSSLVSASAQVTGSTLINLGIPFATGGAGGGGGGGSAGGSGGNGGAGGASIILVAPTIILGSTATLNTSGSNGATGGGGNGGGGGGGGAGNIYIFARSFTDSGATITQTGGSGGSGNVAGGAGQNGVKQINLY